MNALTATIQMVDREHRAVFGLAVDPTLDAGGDELYYSAIQKTCPDRGACHVGAGRLVEFGCLDQVKQEALGFDLGRTGIWLGVELRDGPTWDAIAAGEIKKFDVSVDPLTGLTVTFPRVQKSHKAKGENEMFSEITSSSTRTSCGQPSTVQKVLSSTPETLTRDQVDAALTDFAKSLQGDGESFTDAYSRALRTRTGEALYEKYTLAKVVPIVEKSSQDGPAVSQTWKKITDSAMALQAKDPKLEHHVAIDRVLKENPQLYSDYCDETAAKPAADTASRA